MGSQRRQQICHPVNSLNRGHCFLSLAIITEYYIPNHSVCDIINFRRGYEEWPITFSQDNRASASRKSKPARDIIVFPTSWSVRKWRLPVQSVQKTSTSPFSKERCTMADGVKDISYKVGYVLLGGLGPSINRFGENWTSCSKRYQDQ